MNNIAIIPARGGSKRIHRKNIKDFLGKPIILYSINSALNSNLFDRVIVSTDDEEIATIARDNGAEVPFLRSKKNSSDYATTAEVIEEVILELKKSSDDKISHVCSIYPTAPFVNSELLKQSYNKFISHNGESLFPVCRFGFPPQRALVENDDLVTMLDTENLNKRSQDFEMLYHDVGQFYWIAAESFLKQKKMYLNKSIFFEVDELHSQDIDNLMDWKLAELKFQLLKHENLI